MVPSGTTIAATHRIATVPELSEPSASDPVGGVACTWCAATPIESSARSATQVVADCRRRHLARQRDLAMLGATLGSEAEEPLESCAWTVASWAATIRFVLQPLGRA